MLEGEMMMRSWKRLVTAAVGLLVAVALRGVPAPGDAGSVIFKPAKSYDRGQPMTFTASAVEKPEWITFFFRSSATAEFSVRLMAADQTGGYSTTLSKDDLTADHLEYYLAYKTPARVRYLPEDVPAHFFSTPASAKPMPAAAVAPQVAVVAPRASSFSLVFEGSATQRLADKNGTSIDPAFQQSENLSLAFQAGHEDLQVLLDTRLQYNSLPLGGQKEINFADGRLQVSLGRHSLQAGKISPPGTELGLQPFERNGLAYSFNSTAWQLNLFSLATQQLPGFAGLIVPRDGAGLFGGSLAFSLLNQAVSIRATGLSGRDDPALGINTGFAANFKGRRGDLLSMAATAGLMKNSLMLGSELALSRCDPDTTDSLPAMNDSAWQMSGRYSRGILDLRASLKNIGLDFNSIGQQFMVSDRRSLDAGIGLRFARLRLSAGYLAQRNNTENDSAVPTATDTQANAALGWDLSANLSLQLGYAHGEQNLPATVLSPIGGGVVKDGYSGSLSWRPGRRASLQLSAQHDEFRSTVNPELDGRSLTLNAGGNFQHLDHFTLSGQLGMTLARYTATQKEGRFYYAFVNGDLALLGRLLSLSLIAGYNRSEPGVGDSQQSTSFDGGLVLKTPSAWRIGMAIVALRGKWLKNGTQNDDYRIYIKCDFSLGGTRT
jgi:hypothetical protein